MMNYHITSHHDHFDISTSHLHHFYIADDMSVELRIICQSAHSEFRCISTIQHCLPVDSTKTFLSTFVLSRLDYCNLLLSGYPKHLEKLQKVQNSAARLILKAGKRDKWDHVSPVLQSLHWLHIQAHIEYNLSTLYHPFFSDTAPV